MYVADLKSLSIEQKIGQLFFIGIPGPTIDDTTTKLLRDIQPGGVCLFARNIKELGQTRDLLDGIRTAVSIVPFLSLDQEGGRVDRLRRVMCPMPAASQLRDVSDAEELASIIGDALRMLGFNMDFAPVVDVISPDRKDFVNGLQSRGFGTSKGDVVRMANAFVRQLQASGILGCLKHFPGLAASDVDSHEELPVVRISDEVLDDIDLHPYREILATNDRLSVMVAHAAFPNTRLQPSDPNGNLLPSSLSRCVVTTLLRDELRFNGIAITDDMEMGAIIRNYGIGEASTMAINAGEDMIAICSSVEAIYEGSRAVSEAVSQGRIKKDRLDESVARILTLKSSITEPPVFDESRFEVLSERVRDLNNNLN